MNLISELPEIIRQAKTEYEKLLNLSVDKGKILTAFERKETKNILAHCDNLSFIKYLIFERQMRGKINLIYVDPPFYSKAFYDAVVKLESKKLGISQNIKLLAYEDRWEMGFSDYLLMLTIRFFAIKDLLSSDGCLWVHLDWHAVHYVKIILDEIFGVDKFVNEIIWNYKSGGTGKRSFARKHDTLLVYGKTKNYFFEPLKEKSYNRGLKPYKFKGVEEFEDEIGWHTMVNMKDVWQIDMVGRTSNERNGYATQKPEAMLERIVKSCSREGDICADFFSGSASFCSVAHKLGRSFLSCDQGGIATAVGYKRLKQQSADFTFLENFSVRDEENNAIEICDSKIKLVNYNLDFEELIKKYKFTKEEEEAIKKISLEDSLSLVDYFCVYSYLESKESFLQNSNNITIENESIVNCKQNCYEISIENRLNSKNIGVRIVDIFGDSKMLEFTV